MVNSKHIPTKRDLFMQYVLIGIINLESELNF